MSVNLRSRYNTKKKMPYKYEVVCLLKGEAGSVWDAEKLMHKVHRENNLQYKWPQTLFDGRTECFTEILGKDIKRICKEKNLTSIPQ